MTFSVPQPISNTSSSSCPHSTISNSIETKPKHEERGERRRRRHEASVARREARERCLAELERAPTTREEFARRWDAVYTRTSFTPSPSLLPSATTTKTTIDEHERDNSITNPSRVPYKDRHLLRSVLPELMPEIVRANPRAHVAPLHHQQPQPQPQPQQVEENRKETETKTETETETETEETKTTKTTNQQSVNVYSLDDPLSPRQYLLEVGCGTGSTVFPVLRANSNMYALAFDISSAAVARMKQNTEYMTAERDGRLVAFVGDLTDADSFVPKVRNFSGDQGVHFVTVLWTLSALPTHGRKKAARAIASVVRHGGLVFVRDFGAGDMREQTETWKRVTKEKEGGDEEERLYLRKDGTYAHFFEREEIVKLFEEGNTGMQCVSCEFEEREVQNRKEGIIMHRRWVVAKFRKVEDDDIIVNNKKVTIN